MIEVLRYARLKPEGLASATHVAPEAILVRFKRFNVENGKEDTPEESFVTYSDLEAREEVLKKELDVIREFLALKPR